MDILKRIKELMKERGWSEYRLRIESGLPQSTLNNMFARETTPSIYTLEPICKAFGMTLSQFFGGTDAFYLNEEEKELFASWIRLTDEQKILVMDMMRNFKK